MLRKSFNNIMDRLGLSHRQRMAALAIISVLIALALLGSISALILLFFVIGIA